jgi:DNA-binding HxlR family transcriptional regulator
MLPAYGPSLKKSEILLPVRSFHPVTEYRATRLKVIRRGEAFPAAESRPASRGLDSLSGRWTVPILCEVRRGPVRLGQLTRLLPGASRKMIAETLRRLEAQGLLQRRDFSGKVKHVEYHLAQELRPELELLLDQLVAWGAMLDRYKSELLGQVEA